MRALAITGIETASMMPSIRSGSDMRATPPWERMSAGTRSSAITATAPASSAILACSALTTSMMTPPRSISASPRLTRAVPVVLGSAIVTDYRAGLLFLVGLSLAGLTGRRRHRRYDRRHRGCGRRWQGRELHVDGVSHRQQLDPRLARVQEDRQPVGVHVAGG